MRLILLIATFTVLSMMAVHVSLRSDPPLEGHDDAAARSRARTAPLATSAAVEYFEDAPAVAGVPSTAAAPAAPDAQFAPVVAAGPSFGVLVERARALTPDAVSESLRAVDRAIEAGRYIERSNLNQLSSEERVQLATFLRERNALAAVEVEHLLAEDAASAESISARPAPARNRRRVVDRDEDALRAELEEGHAP